MANARFLTLVVAGVVIVAVAVMASRGKGVFSAASKSLGYRVQYWQSTFRMIAIIFDKHQAGPVLGWTSAVAAYGAFLIPKIFATQIKAGTPKSTAGTA